MNNAHLFPEPLVSAPTPFKDIVTNIIKEEKKEAGLASGWISKTMGENRKIITTYAPSSSSKEPPSFHDQFLVAIQPLKEHWKKTEEDYDEFHGEGSFARRFRCNQMTDDHDDDRNNEDTDEEIIIEEDNNHLIPFL